jgi:hypothetical protein
MFAAAIARPHRWGATSGSHGAVDRVDDAAELRQQPVAVGLDDAATVLARDRVDNRRHRNTISSSNCSGPRSS